MTAAQLRTMRAGAGLSQSALAQRLGVHVQSVSRWERGAREIDTPTAIAIRCVISHMEEHNGLHG